MNTTYLKYIKEYKKGPINQQYVGPIFNRPNTLTSYKQIGFASDIIQATVSATPAAPSPKFDANFDVKQGLTCASLSQLAYKSYRTIRHNVQKHNLRMTYNFFNRRTDTHGFIASNDTTIIVAFRGTDSFKNVVTDLSFVRKKIIPKEREYAHGGFVDALDSVYGRIERHVKQQWKGKKLFITGHSLGGALASLLAYRLSVKHTMKDSEPILYAFGCPPVGDHKFSVFFKGLPSYIITNDGDPISTGALLTLGPWVGLFKPMDVFYLQRKAGHGIQDYIDQLKKL